MSHDIKLGSLSAVRERQILEILNEVSPLYSHQIGHRMVPEHSAALGLVLSDLMCWLLVDKSEKSPSHRLFQITNKGREFLKQLEGDSTCK